MISLEPILRIPGLLGAILTSAVNIVLSLGKGRPGGSRGRRRPRREAAPPMTVTVDVWLPGREGREPLRTRVALGDRSAGDRRQ